MQFLYQPPLEGPGWDVGFYRAIGLETLLENDVARIGTRAQYPGDALGTDVTVAAASELGLVPGRRWPRRCSTQTPGGLAVSLPRARSDAEIGGEQSVRAACNGCARGAHLRPQHLTDVADALALPRAGIVGPVTQDAHHLHVCNVCTCL